MARTTSVYPQYSVPVGSNFASSLSNLGWLQQMCESSSATSPSESIGTIAEGDYMMGGTATAAATPTAAEAATSYRTMALKPEPLCVQTALVPDMEQQQPAMLDGDDDGDDATADNAISMAVRTPWDDLGASSTAAYPIKALRIDALGSSHSHLLFMSVDDTANGSSSSSSNNHNGDTSSNNSSFNNVPSRASSAEDSFSMLGHGNVLSGTEDDSDYDTGGMDVEADDDDDDIAGYATVGKTSSSGAASASHRHQQEAHAAAAGAGAAAAFSSASPSSPSSSSATTKAATKAAKAAAAVQQHSQKKQVLAKQQKAAAAAAKARTGPAPAVPTSRDIAAFDPTKVVAIDGGPADAVLTAHAHNDTTRPPYSYTALIYYAVHAIGKGRVQLGEIYYQIMMSWAYYAARPLETGWKNSIRHNLTVCRCFKKVARAEGESGKGGYWAIDEPLAKIDVSLVPRDSSPRLSRKKLKKKSKSRAFADRKEKPLAFSPSSPQVSRRSAPSPLALEAAAAAAMAAEAVGSEQLSTSSSSSTSDAGMVFAAPAPAGRRGTPRPQRKRGFSSKASPAAPHAAEPEMVYPAHLLAHSIESETDFAPREHDDAGNPHPSILRGPGHTTRVVLPSAELDDSFSGLAGMSLNMSSSFGNALLGSSLGGSNVLSSSFSNLLAGGQLVD